MKIVLGAPSNGAALKDALKAHLTTDPRISEVIDLSSDEVTYPAVSIEAARLIADAQADRAILICGTGVGTAIVANKVAGVRAATAHDLITVRGAVENYDAQVLCLGQNVIAAPAAWALVDLWIDLHHDPASSYGPKLDEISAHEAATFGAGAGQASRTSQ